MPARACRGHICITAGNQLYHQLSAPADEGIRQHGEELHHVSSPSDIDIEEIVFL